MVTNGNSTRRLRIPGIANVRRVTNKLVKETVELIPENITPIINISWAPTPVYLVDDEKGVINVQPAVTKALLEHFVK